MSGIITRTYKVQWQVHREDYYKPKPPQIFDDLDSALEAAKNLLSESDEYTLGKAVSIRRAEQMISSEIK